MTVQEIMSPAMLARAEELYEKQEAKRGISKKKTHAERLADRPKGTKLEERKDELKWHDPGFDPDNINTLPPKSGQIKAVRRLDRVALTAYPMKDTQWKLITFLMERLAEVKPDVHTTADAWLYASIDMEGTEQVLRHHRFTTQAASDVITRLRTQTGFAKGMSMPEWRKTVTIVPAAEPVTPVDVDATPAVKESFEDIVTGHYGGRYAVPDEANPEKVHFYLVKRSKKSGKLYVQEYASDALYFVKWPLAVVILRKIQAMSCEVSGKLYADRIGSCWRCGRTLTDEVSRAAGMGPTCINK